jgi:hypothetical protein
MPIKEGEAGRLILTLNSETPNKKAARGLPFQLLLKLGFTWLLGLLQEPVRP